MNTKRVELKNRLCLLAKIRALSVERQALASTHYEAISKHEQFYFLDQSERIPTPRLGRYTTEGTISVLPANPASIREQKRVASIKGGLFDRAFPLRVMNKDCGERE